MSNILIKGLNVRVQVGTHKEHQCQKKAHRRKKDPSYALI